MKLNPETLAQLRAKMFLIQHHREIITAIEAEMQKIARETIPDLENFEINLDTGEVSEKEGTSE